MSFFLPVLTFTATVSRPSYGYKGYEDFHGYATQPSLYPRYHQHINPGIVKLLGASKLPS